MARTTRQAAETAQAVSPGAELELGPDPLDDAESQEDDALAELRGLGAGGDHKYTVSRVSSEGNRKPGYCQTYSVGDLSLDTIRDQFGGGKYKIRVIDSAGKYVRQTTVDIVDVNKPASAPAIAIPPGADLAGIAQILAAVKSSDGGGSMAQIITMMMAQQKATTDMIVGLMNRPQPQGPSLTDLLALINANKGDKTDPVALLLQGLQLGKEIGGGEGAGMLDVARDALGVLGPLIANQTPTPGAPRDGVQPAAPRPVVRQLPHRGAPAQPAVIPNAGAPVPAAELAEGDSMKMIKQLQWLKAQLNILVLHAARDKDPELYAEVMLDNLPEYVTPEDILARIGADDAVDQLAQVDARVQNYRPWFEKFRNATREFLTDDGEDDEEGEPLPGDVADLDAPGGAE